MKPAIELAKSKSFRFVCAGVLIAMASGGCRSTGSRSAGSTLQHDSVRAIWVTRWDFTSPQAIAQIMEHCRRAGFNTIMFQVRGNGTAFYRSRLEPWADELGGRDPGFDPLAVAVIEAHRRGLALHAWVNVVPGWRGKKPPTNRRQLYFAHADWFWRDARGRREPLGWYNNLNPCYPEVRDYLVSVMREIVQGYRVDGLHMDYIRFPNDEATTDYPRDGRTLALFHRATRTTPDASPMRWNAWRAEQVTQLVRDIRHMVTRVAPRVRLSAAVGASPDRALRAHFQDTRRWLAEGLLDLVFPMNYAATVEEFRKRSAMWAAIRPGIPVVHGVMFDGRTPQTIVPQVEWARSYSGHYAAFAYNSLFERMDRRGRLQFDDQSAARKTLRRQVLPRVHRLAASTHSSVR